eukprot:GDKH01014979.1.p1 GENE.GDKH01014979.1~~GDKH01014979.1.p1  ORF type:complete len:163 (-),score=31.53 GDKH01014979.1:116-604(-)
MSAGEGSSTAGGAAATPHTAHVTPREHVPASASYVEPSGATLPTPRVDSATGMDEDAAAKGKETGLPTALPSASQSGRVSELKGNGTPQSAARAAAASMAKEQLVSEVSFSRDGAEAAFAGAALSGTSPEVGYYVTPACVCAGDAAVSRRRRCVVVAMPGGG